MLSRRSPYLVRLCHHRASPSYAQESVESILVNHAKRIQKLSQQVTAEANTQKRKFAEWRNATDPTVRRIFDCYEHLKTPYFPVIVGSAMTGLANPSQRSDIDVVLFTSLNEDNLERSRIAINSNSTHSKRTLSRAIGVLNKGKFQFQQKDFFPRARFPIAKLLFQVPKGSPLMLEISVDNMVTVRNSVFVRQCLQLDKRVHMLYHWARQWLQKCDLLGSRNGKFSSYHTALLVIHFLQYTNHLNMKPVLPLMMERYKSDLDPELPFRIVHESAGSSLPLNPPPEKSENNMSIGELIVRFVDFYSRIDFRDFTLHIPSGTNIERIDDDYEHIFMVDPYSGGESVCAVPQGVGQLSTAFDLTRHAFSIGQGLGMPFSFTGRALMLSSVSRQAWRGARRLVKASSARNANEPLDHSATLHSGDITTKIESENRDKIARLTDKLRSAESKSRAKHEELVAERSGVIAQLEKVLCSLASRLIPVGSMANSFARSKHSDVDLCFIAEKNDAFLRDFVGNPNFKVTLMRTAADLLEHSSELELACECQLLVRSRIPLIVVKFANGPSVDIQFPANANFQAVRNTNLIRHYVMADRRFSQLYLWARQLFSVLGAKNSKQGLLSSYHIMLLVVHFLQSKHIFSEPVLPILTQTHPHLVAGEIPLSGIIKSLDQPLADSLDGWQSANKMPVGLLAVKMIEYYSRFKVRNTMIDIGRGKSIRRRQTPYNMKLLILDPYSRSTVCHSPEVVEAFTKAIMFTSEAFKQGAMIDSFPLFGDRERVRLETPRTRVLSDVAQ